MSRAGKGGRRALALGSLAAALAASTFVACVETVRPALGALKIGPAGEGPFIVPVLFGEQVPFEYPEDAWKRGVGGQTTLRIHISSSGVVDTVLVAKSSGDRTLDSAAVAGARRLRYRPARNGDQPVAVWAFLPVHYPLPEPVPGDGGGSR